MLSFFTFFALELMRTIRYLNFDGFQESFKTVLLMSTNMYWPNIMYSAIDSTTDLQAPIQVMSFCFRLLA
jgi:hypothetical protein